MTLQKSTIFLREYFYTTLSGTDIEYRSLSYLELETIQNKYDNKKFQQKIITIKASLLNKDDFSKLTSKDVEVLFTNILKTSQVTNEDMLDIKMAVTILMDDSFKDESFKDCSLCQKRGLDKQRNCPLLNEKTHDPMVFYIIDSKKESICPMDKVNSPIINDAFRCHSMSANGFLPTNGGMYDQSMFFVETSILVKGVIDKAQAKAMEDRK